MGITYPGGSSDGADHNDLRTAMDGDAGQDDRGGQPPALADYDPLPEEQPDPPTLLRDGDAGPDDGQGGDEYPLEDPSPS
jgi:hypothetical protein